MCFMTTNCPSLAIIALLLYRFSNPFLRLASVIRECNPQDTQTSQPILGLLPSIAASTDHWVLVRENSSILAELIFIPAASKRAGDSVKERKNISSPNSRQLNFYCAVSNRGTLALGCVC